MKFIIIPALALLIVSCKNNESSTQTGTTDSITVKKDSTANIDPSDLQQIKTELENLTPMSEQELSALLPSDLSGITGSEKVTSTGMGVLSVSAIYQKNDSTSIKVEIVDCAGPAGAGLFSVQYAGIDENLTGDDESTFKVTTFKGFKAIESCLKTRPEDCTFTWFDGKRLLVFMEGKNSGLEQLKRSAVELELQ